MNKKSLTEADIRTKFITPAITGPDGTKWDVMTQIREEFFFTKGRVVVRGKNVKRGLAKKADYLLFYRQNLPLGVLEAKDGSSAASGAPKKSRRTVGLGAFLGLLAMILIQGEMISIAP